MYESGSWYTLLRCSVSTRWGFKSSPVRKIRVDRCVIPLRRANTLKKLVTEFRWDGEEGFMNAFDDFEDLGDYDLDFIEPGARWEDFFVGSTQAEWEWWENFSDGW
jgi:hypothetical protein